MISLALLLSVIGWLPPLEPFAPYAGHCWTAELPGGASDRHCFSAVFDGRHVRDVHVVTQGAQSVYAGETLYSVEQGGIVFTYWNSLGGLGRGKAETVGGDLRFSLTMRATPDGAPQHFDTRWHITSTGYDAITGGETRHFRRDD